MKTFEECVRESVNQIDDLAKWQEMQGLLSNNEELLSVISTALDLYMESLLNRMSEKIEASTRSIMEAAERDE